MFLIYFAISVFTNLTSVKIPGNEFDISFGPVIRRKNYNRYDFIRKGGHRHDIPIKLLFIMWLVVMWKT